MMAKPFLSFSTNNSVIEINCQRNRNRKWFDTTFKSNNSYQEYRTDEDEIPARLLPPFFRRLFERRRVEQPWDETRTLLLSHARAKFLKVIRPRGSGSDMLRAAENPPPFGRTANPWREIRSDVPIGNTSLFSASLAFRSDRCSRNAPFSRF